ncbi:MAG: hypothetical protein FWC50_10560 [Planctomycetaceae bacterium]|nr:hypothetical protein [Planctomycetaceae bacterium]
MASPATQDVCARPKAAAHTGCGINDYTGLSLDNRRVTGQESAKSV